MTLTKQLWLAILSLLLVSLLGSLLISVTTSRHYMEQEILLKNADNANALALSMSQLEKDPVTMELLLAAQFDTGHYRRIELFDPEGETLISRTAGERIANVPGWFVDMVDFDVAAGTATVQDGWRQYGTLELQSVHSFAYRSLWRSMLELSGWFALAGLFSLLLAALLVSRIKRPLATVISQAEDISAKRFTTVAEPRIRELRQVVRAMNALSANVRAMLSKEGRKLEELRRQLQHDRVTGLLNRATFIERFTTYLDSNDRRATGILLLVRVENLDEMNEQVGHAETDQMLQDLAKQLEKLGRQYSDFLTGRMNGRDFALLIPCTDELDKITSSLKLALSMIQKRQKDFSIRFPAAVVDYAQNDNRGELLATLDDALATAENDVTQQIVIRHRERTVLFNTHAEWRTALEEAIAYGPKIEQFPVTTPQGDVLHYESPARLKLRDQWYTAGIFIPWIARLNLEPTLDLAVIDTALETMTEDGVSIGINLSIASIKDASFVMALRARLDAQPALAKKLWFEVPASLDTHDIQSFRNLCQNLRPLGCKFGIEHVSAEFTKLAELHDLGLAYLKIDSSLIRNLHTSPEQQSIVRGIATLCHSLDMLVIGEGVENQKELVCLFRSGVDGATGPAVN
ncbi:EAL domain-containing protein [Halomonas sp. Bachu 37]|uniref:EAL domain-containing protein n=1 Tax=Halomonas kashgarensis TaxID=3084920 RepID=UPI003216FDD5